MPISVVIITRNADAFIQDCLDSLVFQLRPPHEVIVVDARSTDRTQAVVRECQAVHPFVKLYVEPGTRGVGRNYGVARATGDIVAFVDADAICNALWVEEMEKAFATTGADVVAGREVRLGYSGFTSLKRVGMIHKGADITYPSVNLAYKKAVFDEIGGFDPWFKEAEEIDLNFRAVDAGHKLVYWERAVVYHRARESFTGFFKQSFWYGFGRKELTLRHGKLWSKYDPVHMVQVSGGESAWKLVRLALSFLGFMFCRLAGKKKGLKEKFRESKVSER